MSKFPLPWSYFSGALRPSFPTRIHEIHDANGNVVIPWGGFAAIDATEKQRAALAKLIVRSVNEHAEMLATLTLPLRHAQRTKGKRK